MWVDSSGGEFTLSEKVIHLPLKEALVHPFLKHHWTSWYWIIFIQTPNSPFGDDDCEGGCTVTPESLGWNGLSGSFSDRIQTWVWDGNSIGRAFGWSLVGGMWVLHPSLPWQSALVWKVVCIFHRTHIILQFCELHWLPVCFWIQFEVLFWPFKTLRGMESLYLRYNLSPITSSHPTRCSREGMLQILSFKVLHHLAGPGYGPVQLWHLCTLWNILLPKALTFWKSLKTWLYQ